MATKNKSPNTTRNIESLADEFLTYFVYNYRPTARKELIRLFEHIEHRTRVYTKKRVSEKYEEQIQLINNRIKRENNNIHYGNKKEVNQLQT